MKYLLIILITLTSFTNQSYNFTEGFKDGYVDGYCNQSNFCIKPIVPIPPIPAIGQDSYKGGYMTGIKHGMRDSPY